MLGVQNRAGCRVFEVEVETPLGSIALEVWCQEKNRLAGDRVVKHDRRVVGNHHVGGNVQLGDIRVHGHVNRRASDLGLVRRVGIGVSAINHDETFGQLHVLIHEVDRLPVAGCAAIVITPGWRIHDHGLVRVADANFFTDALSLFRSSFAESIVARISGFDNLAAVIECARKDFGAEGRRRNQVVPESRFTIHGLEVTLGEVVILDVATQSLERSAVPGLQIDLAIYLAKVPGKVGVVHEILRGCDCLQPLARSVANRTRASRSFCG